MLAYIKPLDKVIHIRTGLAPEGPWSAARAVATCDRPDDDSGAFCDSLVAHPTLMVPGGGVALTHGVSSFSPTAPPEAYRVRLTSVVLPNDLP
ncbi:MAG: hypothetical protein AB2A00_06570 [Myxococcota bacterium]